MEIMGHSSAEGGEQWLLLPHPTYGAFVVLSGGFDYGSWIEWAGEVSEQDYRRLQLWEHFNYSEREHLKRYLEDTYPGFENTKHM